jgi:hypothetical protein
MMPRPAGRRVVATVTGLTIGYLYDGTNVV